jgi:hypothetical protein
VSVSCFADPEVHARQDRDASCSVNVESGLWNCQGCGEGGGLCDAATELGNTPREAMDLLIAYGLAERRPAGQAQQPRRPIASARPAARPVSRPAEQVALKVGESDVTRWREQLVGVWPPRVLRAAQRSVWSRTVLLELGVWVGARADHDPGPRRFGQPARGCCATPVTITRPRCSRCQGPGLGWFPILRHPGIVDVAGGGSAGHDQRPLARVCRLSRFLAITLAGRVGWVARWPPGLRDHGL